MDAERNVHILVTLLTAYFFSHSINSITTSTSSRGWVIRKVEAFTSMAGQKLPLEVFINVSKT